MTHRQVRVLVMGEALTDLVPAGHGSPALLPRPGGGPADVAVRLARSGVRTTFAGTVGTDAFGRQAEDRLVAAGVELDLCERSSRPTALAVATSSKEGTH
ncbi:PfkB family carbohydrate kinase [Streptomyces sp. NPDC058067]|uniref:PfkB family carbohydrate kinase n=1 Tax=Streptomyces sp. NPDC058067 TaxID=3346324 RepID=UPI0036EF2BFB